MCAAQHGYFDPTTPFQETDADTSTDCLTQAQAFALRAMLAVVLAVAGPCAAAAAAQPAQHTSYWHERASFFSAFTSDAEVAMVGDSLTDGAEWGEMFPGRRIVNRGIDADTTRGVLDRIDGILAVHPARVFVMIGINDFAEEHRSVEAVFADYKTLVSRLQQGGASVVVQSTLPCNVAKGAWKSCKALNPKIRELNARLATLATGRTLFVSLSALVAADGGLRDDLTFDGVHLNGSGYRLWKEAIAPFLP